MLHRFLVTERWPVSTVCPWQPEQRNTCHSWTQPHNWGVCVASRWQTSIDFGDWLQTRTMLTCAQVHGGGSRGLKLSVTLICVQMKAETMMTLEWNTFFHEMYLHLKGFVKDDAISMIQFPWNLQKQAFYFNCGCSRCSANAVLHPNEDPNRLFAFTTSHSCLDSIKFFPPQSEATSAVTSVAVHLFSLISFLPHSLLSSFALSLPLSLFLLLLIALTSPPGLFCGWEKNRANSRKQMHRRTCMHSCTLLAKNPGLNLKIMKHYVGFNCL